ncbi:ATP-binding protein [Phytohabitans houttuyneae]|uniref:ATP-binding protein n=1 Tax=Phytohabitans houttuyneae TaxID=1076126 RepID=UPI001567A790|nr:ATP-binding protein [Phytohabitans houttuyneae]
MTRVQMSLRLPRDVHGLALVRAVADRFLTACGASGDCRQDLIAGLVEACGNAIRHALKVDEYTVMLTVDGESCVVEVSDEGLGFAMHGPPGAPPPTAVSGRGLYMIDQLADWLQVDSQPGRGTTVRFAKSLA